MKKNLIVLVFLVFVLALGCAPAQKNRKEIDCRNTTQQCNQEAMSLLIRYLLIENKYDAFYYRQARRAFIKKGCLVECYELPEK